MPKCRSLCSPLETTPLLWTKHKFICCKARSQCPYWCTSAAIQWTCRILWSFHHSTMVLWRGSSMTVRFQNRSLKLGLCNHSFSYCSWEVSQPLRSRLLRAELEVLSYSSLRSRCSLLFRLNQSSSVASFESNFKFNFFVLVCLSKIRWVNVC